MGAMAHDEDQGPEPESRDTTAAAVLAEMQALDDEAAAVELAALRTLEGVVDLAEATGQVAGEDLEEARRALEVLFALAEDWYGTERVELLAGAAAGSA